MKHQNEHIQVAVVGAAALHTAAAEAGDGSCRQAVANAVAAESRIVAADILGQALVATRRDSAAAAAATATVVVGMVVEEMRQVEEVAEVLEDKERWAFVVAAEDSRIGPVAAAIMGVEELKTLGRPDRAHLVQLQQGARICS